MRHNPLRILDLGCGIHSSENIYGKFSIHHITGVDIDGENIKVMKKAYPQHTFIKADIRKLPIDKKFDIIFCLHVLEHLENPEKALQEIKRLSGKNTTIFISIPHPHLDYILGKIIPGYHNRSYHVNQFDEQHLLKIIEKERLKRIAVRRQKWLIAVALTMTSLLHRLAGWPRKHKKEVYYFINPYNQQKDPVWLKWFRNTAIFADYLPPINFLNYIYPLEIMVEISI